MSIIQNTLSRQVLDGLRTAYPAPDEYLGIDPAGALNDLLRALGHSSPADIPLRLLGEVAQQLSAQAGKAEPWTAKYLRNIQHGTQKPSRQVMDAILRMGAAQAGLRKELALGVQVQAISMHPVHEGVLILAEEKLCKYPPCGLWFIPRSGNQKYHCPDCGTKDRK